MFQKWSPFAYFSQTNILNYHKNSKKKKKWILDTLEILKFYDSEGKVCDVSHVIVELDCFHPKVFPINPSMLTVSHE